jgi:phosphoribosylaminoimidazolecarboxamide formyltransferase / IMP cyclohydrolase
MTITRALLSVSDKTGLIDFAKALAAKGVMLLSTGGTAKALKEAGISVTDVSDVTGFPEIMDGRVKTLHPKVHGGLLAVRKNQTHLEQMQQHRINAIDLLVVNLYPFEATVARGAGYEDTIENIDVGGPAMIRAAAKNHESVTVVVEPEDYQVVLDEMSAHAGDTTAGTRRHLAAKAFARTAAYDTAIARWFDGLENAAEPAYFTTGGKRAMQLRYGENPHQKAAAFRNPDSRHGILDATQVQGKDLSYNNINDADAALQAIAEFRNGGLPACVIVKHANPCGVAEAETLHAAYQKALACDSTSAFGGILAFNRALDEATADAISAIFTEVIVAPGASDEARAILARKKNLRLLLVNDLPDPAAAAVMAKSIVGGLLVQTADTATTASFAPRIVTKRAPTEQEMRDLLFAWKVVKHVKSNAIVFVKDASTVGIGAGQMSRIDSTRIAVRKSEDAAGNAGSSQAWVRGSVLASDAFFPFADGIAAAAEAGATAIIQPGGSLKDADVIAEADRRGLAMLFTGIRHFRH